MDRAGFSRLVRSPRASIGCQNPTPVGCCSHHARQWRRLSGDGSKIGEAMSGRGKATQLNVDVGFPTGVSPRGEGEGLNRPTVGSSSGRCAVPWWHAAQRMLQLPAPPAAKEERVSFSPHQQGWQESPPFTARRSSWLSGPILPPRRDPMFNRKGGADAHRTRLGAGSIGKQQLLQHPQHEHDHLQPPPFTARRSSWLSRPTLPPRRDPLCNRKGGADAHCTRLGARCAGSIGKQHPQHEYDHLQPPPKAAEPAHSCPTCCCQS